MKRFVIFFLAVVAFLPVIAQEVMARPSIQICTGKTTSLVFSNAIKFVDIGTQDVLVKQVMQAENLLLVKAAVANFQATNLTVVTADGTVHAIDVVFDVRPSQLVFHIDVKAQGVSLVGETAIGPVLKALAEGILDNEHQSRGIRDRSWGMLAKVKGVYVHDHVLFFHLMLDNRSAIRYDIDYVRFFTKDKKTGKRSVLQEIELPVLYSARSGEKVEPNNQVNLVFALEKFTIPGAKVFTIQIGEKKGGRMLRLRVRNGNIMQSKRI